MLLRLFIAAAALVAPYDSVTRGFLPSALFNAHAIAFDDAEAPLFDGDEGRYETALLLLAIGHHESRWNPSVVSPGGDSGIMQTQALWWAGHTRAEILADPELAFRTGLHALQKLRSICGGAALRWLGAFASGKCGGAPVVAKELCGPVGLCDRT